MLINLDFEFDQPKVRLGENISGSMIWQGRSANKSVNISLDVGWITSGKGKTDAETIAHQIFAGLLPDQIIPFAIALPRYAPPTYDGKLIRIEWRLIITIAVIGFMGRFGNQQEQISHPFIVLPAFQ